MLTKSLSLTSDNITYDLEDAVSASMKPSARKSLHTHLTTLPSRPSSLGELAVRINAVSTPYALDDLLSIAAIPTVDTIVIPKVNSPADLSFVTDVLRHTAPNRKPIKLIALIESARAVMDLRAICAAGAESNLDGLIFAAEDFALDLSITRTPSRWCSGGQTPLRRW